MAEWTPDNWCACPKCAGPSFPVDEAGEPASANELTCHACEHHWEGTPSEVRTARAMASHRSAGGRHWHIDALGPSVWWETQARLWKQRVADERAKYARAMEGRW